MQTKIVKNEKKEIATCFSQPLFVIAMTIIFTTHNTHSLRKKGELMNNYILTHRPAKVKNNFPSNLDAIHLNIKCESVGLPTDSTS